MDTYSNDHNLTLTINIKINNLNIIYTLNELIKKILRSIGCIPPPLRIVFCKGTACCIIEFKFNTPKNKVGGITVLLDCSSRSSSSLFNIYLVIIFWSQF